MVSLEDVRYQIQAWFSSCYDLQDVRELYSAICTESDRQFDIHVEEIVKLSLEAKKNA